MTKMTKEVLDKKTEFLDKMAELHHAARKLSNSRDETTRRFGKIVCSNLFELGGLLHDAGTISQGTMHRFFNKTSSYK